MKAGKGSFQGSWRWLSSLPSFFGFIPNSRPFERGHPRVDDGYAHQSSLGAPEVVAYMASDALRGSTILGHLPNGDTPRSIRRLPVVESEAAAQGWVSAAVLARGGRGRRSRRPR